MFALFYVVLIFCLLFNSVIIIKVNEQKNDLKVEFKCDKNLNISWRKEKVSTVKQSERNWMFGV